jgi:hypothetical protein
MALKENSPLANNFLTIKHHAICKELNPKPSTPEEIEEALRNKYQELTVENPSDIKPDGSKGTVQKWVRKFGSLEGKIVGLEWYDRKQNVNGREVRFMGLKMKIKDDETYILDLPFGTKGYDVFTRVMEDIEYSKPIEISVWHDKKNGNATAVLFRQDGDSIKWRYTREWNNNVVRGLGASKHTEQLGYDLHEALEAGAVGADLMQKVIDAGFVVAPPPVHNPLAKPQWNFDAQRAFLWNRLNNIVIPKVQELNPKFDEPVPEEVDPTDFTPPDGDIPFGPDDVKPIQKAVPTAQAQAAAAPAAAPADPLPNGGFTGMPLPAEEPSGWVPPGAEPQY